jgi:hypothetical protein
MKTTTNSILCLFSVSNLQQFFLKSVFCLFIVSFSSSSQAQVALVFNNGAGEGALFSGVAGTVGAIYQWPNVGTEGGVTIKAKIEIISITGGATLTTIDGASTIVDWEPQVAGPSTTVGNSWGMKFQIRFYNAATDALYTISTFKAQGIDIDGGGGGSTLREYNTFDTPITSYTLETPTQLTASSVSGGTKFTSSSSAFSGISLAQTQYIASCYYTNVNSISITCGVSAVGGTVNATNRLHSFNFNNGTTFAAPVVVLPIELVSFEAQKMGREDVQLDWSTVSEVNNSHFTLEKLVPPQDISILTIVEGAGTSYQLHNYQYVLTRPVNEILYFRLKQTDYDGKSFYSSIVSLDNTLKIKEISSKVNLLGVEVNEYYKGVVIITYDDGSTEKTMQ